MRLCSRGTACSLKGTQKNPKPNSSLFRVEAGSATLLYLVTALLKLICYELLQKKSSQQQASRSQGGKKKFNYDYN